MSENHEKNMQKWKTKIFKTGMVFGTFDLFHAGHEFYICEAKKHCENLVVVVARDARVLSGKWFFPNENEDLRREKIAKFLEKKFGENSKNLVILGDEKNIFAPIEEFSPEILFFGYDQKAPEKTLAEKFPNITTMRIGSYFPEKFKSSILRKNLEKNSEK